MTKRILSLVLCLTIIVGELVFFPAPVKAEQGSGSQIPTKPYFVDGDPTNLNNPSITYTRTYPEGSDRVTLEKIISKTDKENEFDITLNVKTYDIIKNTPVPVDAAVTIVLDYSYSMDPTDDIKPMRTAVKNFIDGFGSDANGAKRYVSVVVYGTNVHILQPTSGTNWYDVSNSTTRTNLKNAVEKQSQESSYPRTNTQGGLIWANNLMQDDKVKDFDHRYVILMTDGMPNTILLKSSDTTGSTNQSKWPADTTLGWPNDKRYEVDNSDGNHDEYIYAADRATQEAEKIRDQGIEIHALGYGDDINKWLYAQGQLTGSRYKKDANSQGISSNGKQLITGEEWLTDYIGDYYYDATDKIDLGDQFASITEKITSSARAWVVKDPMGENIKLMGIYDSNGQLSSATHGATTNGDGINWDLTTISAITDTTGSKTSYLYTLRYRIKLDTLADDFSTDIIYKTNGDTTVDYVLYENDVPDGPYTGEFSVPSVKGYKDSQTGPINFQFVKTDDNNTPLGQAVFTLTTKDDPSWSMEVKSDSNGIVTFEDIPSGHDYLLTEVEAPTGYAKFDKPYHVKVHYGQISVTDENDQPVDVGKLTVPNEDYILPVKKIWMDNATTHPEISVTLKVGQKTQTINHSKVGIYMKRYQVLLEIFLVFSEKLLYSLFETTCH